MRPTAIDSSRPLNSRMTSRSRAIEVEPPAKSWSSDHRRDEEKPHRPRVTELVLRLLEVREPLSGRGGDDLGPGGLEVGRAGGEPLQAVDELPKRGSGRRRDGLHSSARPLTRSAARGSRHRLRAPRAPSAPPESARRRRAVEGRTPGSLEGGTAVLGPELGRVGPPLDAGKQVGLRLEGGSQGIECREDFGRGCRPRPRRGCRAFRRTARCSGASSWWKSAEGSIRSARSCLELEDRRGPAEGDDAAGCQKQERELGEAGDRKGQRGKEPPQQTRSRASGRFALHGLPLSSMSLWRTLPGATPRKMPHGTSRLIAGGTRSNLLNSPKLNTNGDSRQERVTLQGGYPGLAAGVRREERSLQLPRIPSLPARL